MLLLDIDEGFKSLLLHRGLVKGGGYEVNNIAQNNWNKTQHFGAQMRRNCLGYRLFGLKIALFHQNGVLFNHPVINVTKCTKISEI